MLDKLYVWLHKRSSCAAERGEYSAGYWQNQVRNRALQLYSASGKRMLEVGCGEALFLAELAAANKAAQVYGVDNREAILEKAEKRISGKNINNVRLCRADATNLPFGDADFDTVFCINVIFNLESAETAKKVIRELARVCKKGGRVIFDFRNKRNPLLNFKYKLAPYYDQTLRGLPLTTYTAKDIRQLLDRTDLEITRQLPLGLPLKNIAPVIILETKKL